MIVTVWMKRFAADESGATAIEYCMIAVFVSIVSVSAWISIGTNISSLNARVLPGLQ
jgi:pilus assembly protein Flp/PilA